MYIKATNALACQRKRPQAQADMGSICTRISTSMLVCPTNGMLAEGATDDPHSPMNSSLPEHRGAPAPQPGNLLSYICVTLWSLLCLASVSKPDLQQHWESKQTDELWKKQADMVVSRLSNSITAAGLILATTTVFMTTVPPKNA
ncbi:hypothetical protein BS17DRAFT_480074 [Gyrodon lividus]|nr:hypothetical protein BS17DRAFT_480074 [Gyrodon lividus]